MDEQYGVFASYYDTLISDVDYDEWYSFIKKEFAKYSVPANSHILDLACGSGAFSLRLSNDGFDVTGVDLSENMLALANAKCQGKVNMPLFVCEDMRYLDLYGTVDGAISCLDGMNYLSKASDLESTFKRVKLFLNEGAPFIFDVNTKYKFENILSDNVFVYERDGLFCTWENFYNPKTGVCPFRLTFFKEGKDGKWTREEEFQKEKAFSDRTIVKSLEKAGFTEINVYSGFNEEPAGNTDERHFFVCR